MGPTALAIVRGLGRHGVDVYGVALTRGEVSYHSRYCRPLWTINPQQRPELLCSRLEEFAAANSSRRIVLFPSGDEYVVFLSGNYYRLRERFDLYEGLAPEVANRLMGKRAFYELCQSAGVPTAMSRFPQDAEHAQRLADELTYPCLIKPVENTRWRQEFGLRKCFVCSDRRQYLQHLSQLQSFMGNLLIQEIIPGEESEICSYIVYIDRQGRPQGGVTTRKVRQYPPGFGTGSCVRSSLEPDIVAPSLRVLQEAGYRGMAEVEFKWCPVQRVHKVLDVNLRPCRLHSLAEAAGSGSLVHCFGDLTREPIAVHDQPQKAGITWIFTIRDVLAIVKGLARGRFGLGQVLRSYARPRVWCIWAKDDRMPFFAYFVECVVKTVALLGRRLMPKHETKKEQH